MTELERTFFYTLDDLHNAVNAYECAVTSFVNKQRKVLIEMDHAQRLLDEHRAAYDKHVEAEMAKEDEP